MKWEIFFGLRMIESRRRRSLLSPITLTAILSITFGVAAMLVTLSVVTGFQEAYQKAILGFNSHLIIVGEGDISDVNEIREKILSFRPTLTAVTPFIYREGLGVVKDGVSNVVLKGVEPETMESVYHVHFEPLVSSSDLKGLLSLHPKAFPPVIVGRELLKKFFPDGVPKEPVIRLLIPKVVQGKNYSLSDFAQNFLVVGSFESGLYEFDSQFVLSSLQSMQSIFHLSGVSGFEAALDDPDKAPDLARTVEAALPPPFQVISWNELNEALFSAMKMEKTLFLVIMLVIILIASFNAVGVIVMMILNRQQDIAILKALGAEPQGLIRSFSLQGIFLGLMGSFLGSLLSFGLLFSLDKYHWFKLDPQIYFISHLPVVWPKGAWIIMVGVSLAICYGTSQLTTRLTLKEGAFRQMFR